MEIDEHLKYTLSVFPHPRHIFDRLISYVACNSTRAREPVNPWCRGVGSFPLPSDI
jgi:hypothetical protein